MFKIETFLKVSDKDIPKYLYENGCSEYVHKYQDYDRETNYVLEYEGRRVSIEELAFKLRDEVKGDIVHYTDRFILDNSFRRVHRTRISIDSSFTEDFSIWLIFESTAIDWVAAAIAAKEKAE